MATTTTARRARARKRITRQAFPATMRAAVIKEFGGPDAFSIEKVPVPRLGPNDVLIAVAAAGVGSWDPSIRSGEWAEDNTKFPLILGTDGCGTVVARGPRVTRLQLGNRVYFYGYGNSKGGSYAEYVAVAANKAARNPARLDTIAAAAAPAIGLTALQG